MKTITISTDITLTATQFTIDAYLRERAKIATEKRWRAQLDDLVDWLANPVNWQDENYSDIFKDVYGFRPHW